MSKQLSRSPLSPSANADVIALGERKPSRAQAEAAVSTLLRWIGEDPNREGLRETPARVVRAFDEFFAGYKANPKELLSTTFEDIGSYDELVLVDNIEVQSHCEHHMLPFTGRAHVAYLPHGKVLGISKLARVVDAFSRRLQTQEVLTVQIAEAIQQQLNPRGVAVLIEAEHECMVRRGVLKAGTKTYTSHYTGELTSDEHRARFLRLIELSRSQD